MRNHCQVLPLCHYLQLKISKITLTMKVNTVAAFSSKIKTKHQHNVVFDVDVKNHWRWFGRSRRSLLFWSYSTSCVWDKWLSCLLFIRAINQGVVNKWKWTSQCHLRTTKSRFCCELFELEMFNKDIQYNLWTTSNICLNSDRHLFWVVSTELQ